MIPIRKVAFGLSIASGAVLAAWLLTGDRKERARTYLVKRTENIRKALKSERSEYDDSEVHYI
jgi:hypothetical protein